MKTRTQQQEASSQRREEQHREPNQHWDVSYLYLAALGALMRTERQGIHFVNNNVSNAYYLSASGHTDGADAKVKQRQSGFIES